MEIQTTSTEMKGSWINNELHEEKPLGKKQPISHEYHHKQSIANTLRLEGKIIPNDSISIVPGTMIMRVSFLQSHSLLHSISLTNILCNVT